MTFVFKYRRRFFWHRIKVTGHRFEAAQDKMVLFLPDGGLREIPHWKDCAVSLGKDWVLAVQKTAEKQTGQAVPVHPEG